MNTEGSLQLIHSLEMRRMRKMWDEKSLDALQKPITNQTTSNYYVTKKEL